MRKRPAGESILAFVAFVALLSICLGSLDAVLWSQGGAGQDGARPQAATDDSLRVTLLGTGGGPGVNLQQFGASTLVEAGGNRLLFDCGRGATIRLVQAGVPIGSVSRLFLTHLHSDHVVQIPDLLLAGAVGPAGRKSPLEVWGPDGTSDMMAAIERAFAFDIRVRQPTEGFTVRSHDIKQGLVFDEGGVRVTAFLVDHAPVAPAFGFRVDYRGRSVVLSGDTGVSENLIKFATGVDLLVHEGAGGTGEQATPTIGAHTTAAQAGEVFARVKPRLAVYSHARNSEALIAQTRKNYSGPLQGPEDLLTIDVGEQITVRHSAP